MYFYFKLFITYFVYEGQKRNTYADLVNNIVL